MKALELYSEPYSPTGNIAASGTRRTLRSSKLDSLSLLVREAVQNSNDAGRVAKATEIVFGISYAPLTDNQRQILNSQILTKLPKALGLDKDPVDIMRDPGLGILSVYDRHTTGLGGPTRADVSHSGEEPTDFVDFLRNIGSPQTTPLGGGTYGYGKAALFNVSRINSVCVHTHCTDRGVPVSRLMAAGLGPTFEKGGHRFTGRHWWGVQENDDVADPVAGADADELALAVGLPAFSGDVRGTTVGVIAPFFDGSSEGAASARDQLIRAFYLWCWPKLTGLLPPPRVSFEVTWNGEEVSLPSLDALSGMSGFVEALRAAARMHGLDRAARASLTSSWPIFMLRPARRVGSLAVTAAPVIDESSRDWPASGDEEGSDLPWESAPVIARMRQVGLVVDYLRGPSMTNPGLTYSGVFMPVPDVDDAFAAAEPPSHDEWNYSAVEDGAKKSVVRVAGNRVQLQLEEYAQPASPGGDSASQTISLGRLADDLARLLPGVEATGLGGLPHGRVPSNTGTSGGHTRIRYDTPTLREFRGSRVMNVPFTVSTAASDATLAAHLSVEVDRAGAGATEDSAPDGAPSPELLGWMRPGGQLQAKPPTVDANSEEAWVLVASVPDDVAVRVFVELDD